MWDSRRAMMLRTIALLLLVAAVFGRVAAHEFVNIDDDKFLYANERFLPPTTGALAHFWRHAHAHLYVPVTMTAWWLLAQAGLVRDAAAPGGYALNPWVFHIASLLVHAVNVLLVRRLLRHVLRDDRDAAIAAAVFAVHPLAVETVAWASELKDLLAALFQLLAVDAAFRATRSDARGRAAWWGGAVGCFLLALLSKPSAVTLPVVAAAVLWLLAARRRDVALVLIIGLALAAPVAWWTHAAQPAADVPAPPPWQRPIVAADAVAFYLGKVVWPLGLGFDYGRTPQRIFATGAAYWTWLVPVLVTLLAALSRKPLLVAAWVIFLAAPAANLGLLPFDFQAVSTVADHYVYVSLFGATIAVGWLLRRWPKLMPAVVAAVIVLAVLSLVQAGHWRDSHTLWGRTIAVNRDSGIGHANLGALLLSEGKPREALPLLRRAAELDPGDAFAWLNLIHAHLAVGDTNAAADAAERLVAAYRRRSDFDPGLVAAVLDRFAAAIAARGDQENARRLQEESWRLRAD